MAKVNAKNVSFDPMELSMLYICYMYNDNSVIFYI